MLLELKLIHVSKRTPGDRGWFLHKPVVIHYNFSIASLLQSDLLWYFSRYALTLISTLCRLLVKDKWPHPWRMTIPGAHFSVYLPDLCQATIGEEWYHHPKYAYRWNPTGDLSDNTDPMCEKAPIIPSFSKKCWPILDQVMAWCRQAKSHYLSRCWHWTVI